MPSGVGRLAEEPIGRLNQDAGAVARVGFAAARAAVLEVDEHLEPALDDGVRSHALDVDDEPDAAGVVFVAGVIQALGLRRRQMNRMSHSCVLVHSVYRLSATRSEIQ